MAIVQVHGDEESLYTHWYGMLMHWWRQMRVLIVSLSATKVSHASIKVYKFCRPYSFVLLMVPIYGHLLAATGKNGNQGRNIAPTSCLGTTSLLYMPMLYNHCLLSKKKKIYITIVWPNRKLFFFLFFFGGQCVYIYSLNSQNIS